MGGGEGEMYGESNMETYVTICKIDSQWEFAERLTNSNRGSVSTERGAMGREMGGKFKREGIYVYLWLVPNRKRSSSRLSIVTLLI